MANKKGTGLLMVWADVPADREDELNRWYNEEHLADQLAIPGFLSAARYEVVSGGPKHLACYEMENPEVRNSEAQRQLQRDPSEWTRRFSYRTTATNFILNYYEMIHPAEVTPEMASSDMAPALQIGRMDIPASKEAEFNEWYNTIYVPNYEKVPGCIRGRRYRAIGGEPKYLVVYEFEHEKVSESPEWAAQRDASPVTAQIRPHMRHGPGSPGIWRKTFQH